VTKKQCVSYVCLTAAKKVGEFLADVADLTSQVIDAYQNAVGANTMQCYRLSHDRGAGTIPSSCGDWENSAGLCYERCHHNYYPVWFVCWQHCWAICNEGWHDHGAICHIPMHSYWVRPACTSHKSSQKACCCTCTATVHGMCCCLHFV
jgi:hypothetical protein